MGSADKHVLAARGVDLLPSRCTISNVNNNPIQSTKLFKKKYMMIGILKQTVSCCIHSLSHYFTPYLLFVSFAQYLSSVTLFWGVFIACHAATRTTNLHHH
jgi:hypothetical protein